MNLLDDTQRTSSVTRNLRVAGEVCLFGLIAFSPWPFASNDPRFEAILACGILVLVGLWCLHATLVDRITITWDTVTISLFGLIAWTVFQLIPLPTALVGVLSPTRLAWHESYLPAQLEQFPNDTAVVARATFIPLTIDRTATVTFLMQLIQIALVYLVARNWLAHWNAMRRLAWGLVALGAILALFALVQLFFGPQGHIYWTIPVSGSVFGPFVCRNHYPDFVILCMGLSVGLLIPVREKGQSQDRVQNFLTEILTPYGVAVVGAMGLMSSSIAFSYSRGAIICIVFALAATALLMMIFRPREVVWASALAIFAGTMIVVLMLVGWLGIDGILERLGTIQLSDPASSRGSLWNDVGALLPSFWRTGAGGGTFVWVEPVARVSGSASDVVEHAHNEYLEAVVEGGLVRFVLTAALPLGLLIQLVRGYLSRRERSVAPFLLGLLLAFLAVALHALGEFSLHMPAVALITAAVAGFAMAAATDTDFAPPVKRKGSRKATLEPTVNNPPIPDQLPHSESPSEPLAKKRHSRRWVTRLTGQSSLIACAILLILGFLAARDAISRERAYRWQLAADWVYREFKREDRLAERVQYLERALAYRPNDPELLFQTAQARIDLVVSLVARRRQGVTPASGPDLTVPIDRFPQDLVTEHLLPVLRLLQAARQANPIAPKPHTRLAFYAEAFKQSEPSHVHFDRAKQLLPRDSDLWYSSGKLAYERGDWRRAWADWRRSLELSPQHLQAIVDSAKEVLMPWQLLAAVLPEQPDIVFKVAEQSFRDPADAKTRRLFLLAAVAYASRPGATPAQLTAMARAQEELHQRASAGESWRRATELAPNDPTIRDGYARWLEAEERYDEALVQLAWLSSNNPDSKAIQERIEAASRAKLIMDTLDGKNGQNR